MKCWKYQQSCESSYYNKFGIQVTLRSRDALAGSALVRPSPIMAARDGLPLRCTGHG